MGDPMPLKKGLDIEGLILKMFEETSKLKVHDVAKSAGLSSSNESERKKSNEHLKNYLERGF